MTSKYERRLARWRTRNSWSSDSFLGTLDRATVLNRKKTQKVTRIYRSNLLKALQATRALWLGNVFKSWKIGNIASSIEKNYLNYTAKILNYVLNW